MEIIYSYVLEQTIYKNNEKCLNFIKKENGKKWIILKK